VFSTCSIFLPYEVFFGLCFALYAVSGIHAETIAAGTTIDVRTNGVIDARDAGNGRVYSGQVDRDVFDRDNRVAIPRGSDVELMVRDIGHHTLALDLDGVVVNGKRYSVTTYDVTRDGEQKDGVGANRRTGKFVGGGALFARYLAQWPAAGKGRRSGLWPVVRRALWASWPHEESACTFPPNQFSRSSCSSR
jgi:hypothetical protein